MNSLIINVENINLSVKGDTIILECVINTDLTGYKIRCSFNDDTGNQIKLATSNSGGSDSEILVSDLANGEFTITCAKDLTDSFEDKTFIEIEVENASGQVRTLFKEAIILKKDLLTWTSSS